MLCKFKTTHYIRPTKKLLRDTASWTNLALTWPQPGSDDEFSAILQGFKSFTASSLIDCLKELVMHKTWRRELFMIVGVMADF